MALYKITTKGSDKVRLVEASTSAAALKHVAADAFTADVINSTAEAAKIAAGGVVVETAGEPVPEVKDETKSKSDAGETKDGGEEKGGE